MPSASDGITGNMQRGVLQDLKDTPKIRGAVCTPLPVPFKVGLALNGARV
jgi:hypothetical protein